MEAEKAPPAAVGASPAKIKIAGAWSGALEVDLAVWTLPMLRDEVARRSGAGDGGRVNLISAGKMLKDGEGGAPPPSLLQLGLKNNSKLLATVVSADRGKALNDEAAASAAAEKAEAERASKLTRLREAAKAMAERHADGSLPMENFNIELEDQSGQQVMIGSESDKRAVMMGLMLHANAKSFINKQMYKDALDVLHMAEEAFSLCDPKFIEMIDNVPILQLDTVWCYFLLRDISCLSVAGERLVKARKGFERSHGKDSTRFKLLQAARNAELAIYLRLELLEGVVAYHSGNLKEARKALSSAQAKFVQLQVSDEALSILMGMGYKEREAKRALKMTGQDIQLAVDFLVEERAKKFRRKKENLQRQRDISEQKRYGTTAQNKAVDLKKLNELVSIGFERCLAAEALRMNENDFQTALDLLTDPDRNCVLQSQLESRKKARPSIATAAEIEELVSMGFERSAVMNALRSSLTREDALRLLSGDPQGNSNPPTRNQEGSSVAAAASNHVGEGDEASLMDGANEEEKYKEERDEAMEDEITKELTGDPFADYDIEVTKEGEAVAEYLVLLDAAATAS